MTDDRRRFARIHFDAPALLWVNEQALAVTVADLSLKGALVKLLGDASAPAVGVSCELALPIGGDPAAIRMPGALNHIEGDLLGLSCTGLDLDSVTHLRQLIALNLGDPALLERELKALIIP